MPFSLTVCADDYGMTEGVSRGILETAVAGRINAASAMTSLPDWPRAARAWMEDAPAAGLGLHLNLTVGAPLGPMRLLAGRGHLPSIGLLVKARDLPVAEIRAEFGRQMDTFTQRAGRIPAHVDGHQHVHVLPGARQALFEALAERGWTSMTLRDSADRFLRIFRRRTAFVKAMTVAGLGRGFGREARSAGFTCNEGFAGFSAFDPETDMDRQFRRFLVAPGARHLVMCHPGHPDKALRSLDPVTDSRAAELRFLLSDRWPGLLREAGARLCATERDVS